MSVSRGDDAVEGRDETFEAFLGDQTIDGCLCCLDLREIGVQGERALVDVLPGDGIRACK